MRRLLMVVNAFENDAPTRLMFEVCKAAEASGRFQTTMAALSRGGPLHALATDALGKAVVLAGGGLNIRRGFIQLRSLIEQEKPEIVHLSLLRPSLLGMWAGYGGTRVVTCHGTHEWSEASPFPHWLVRNRYVNAVSHARVIVAVSGHVRDELASAGVTRTRIELIPNGVDAEQFAPGSDQKDGNSSEPDRAFLVGAVGNLRRIKGFDVLIQAAAVLDRAIPLKIRIWGDGPERPELQSLIDANGLRNIVTLKGSTNEVPAQLRQCDAYVQPSRQESFGLAAAEAMACGLPVIVSDAGGLPELVGASDTSAGLIFRSGDPASLATRLRELYADEQQRQQMGVSARKRILANFTLEHMTSAYMRLYDDLETAPIRA